MKKILLVSCLTAWMFSACSIKDNNTQNSKNIINASIQFSNLLGSEINNDANGLIIFYTKDCKYTGFGTYVYSKNRVFVELKNKECLVNNVAHVIPIEGYVIDNNEIGIEPIINNSSNFLYKVSLKNKKDVSLVIKNEYNLKQ